VCCVCEALNQSVSLSCPLQLLKYEGLFNCSTFMGLQMHSKQLAAVQLLLFAYVVQAGKGNKLTQHADNLYIKAAVKHLAGPGHCFCSKLLNKCVHCINKPNGDGILWCCGLAIPIECSHMQES
jgi:hypothetical protein